MTLIVFSWRKRCNFLSSPYILTPKSRNPNIITFLSCVHTVLQFVPVVFQKAINGVKIDESTEKGYVSFK
jgi:hypothetical protein